MANYRRKRTGKGFRTAKTRKGGIKKAVKDVLARELELKKAYFLGQITLNGTTDNAYLDLGQINQGITNANRIGNKVHVKSVKYRMYVDMGTVDSNLRFSIVKTKTNAFAGTSMPNLEGYFDKDRFMVKKDLVIQRNSANRYRMLTGYCKGATGFITYDDGTLTSAMKGTPFIGFKGHGVSTWSQVIGYSVEVCYTDS